MESANPETLPLRMVLSDFKLTFTVQKRVAFGRGLYLVGNLPELGNWNPDFAVKLFWMEGDHWSQTVTVKLPNNKPTTVQYKFIETDYSRMNKAELVWEEGPNRLIIVDTNQTSFCGHLEHLQLQSSHKVMPHNFSNNSLIQSFDCQGMAVDELRSSLVNISKIEFICLQNLHAQTLREVLPTFPYHMVYFAEDCRGIVSPILYTFSHWHLVKARTIMKDKDNIGSSATFCSRGYVLTICNGQSKELFRPELEDTQDEHRGYFDCLETSKSKQITLTYISNQIEQQSHCRDGLLCSQNKESERKNGSPATSPPHLTNLQFIGSS